jgi:uncharacterized protein (TIGR03437 family)
MLWSRLFPALALALATGASGFAQAPLIYNRSILNAASFMPNGLPGGAIAQGSIFSLFGANLGPTKGVQVSAFPLATSLANVSIAVTQGSTTTNAIPLYVSGSQINAIMPSATPVGAVSVRVTYNGLKSNPMTTVVAQSAPGVFSARGTGFGPGIFFNFVSQSSQPINSPTVAAQPGQVITLYGTGLGPVPSDTVAPTAGNLPTKVEVFVGGVSAAVQYSGRTPCCSGLDQIVFNVPSSAPQGCWVPVSVRTAGTTVSNLTTLAITPDGSSCFIANPPLPFVTAGNYGAFAAIRATTQEDVGTKAPINVMADYQTSVVMNVASSQFPFHPVLSLPPAGTCTSYSVKGDLLRGDTLPDYITTTMPTPLASSFTLTGPNGTQMFPGLLSPVLNYLGAALSNNLVPNTLFLNPGSYQVSGTGNGSVGSFSASLSAPAPLTWTNRDQLLTVNRTQPLPISWTGGGAGLTVAIIGFGVDLPTNTTTVFGCLTPDGATSFTVPAMAMSNMPATRANVLQSKSVIYLLSYPDSGLVALNATGLDKSYAAFTYLNGKTVIFQ